MFPPARVPAVQQSCRLFFKLRFNKCWEEDTQANDCSPACSLFLNCVVFQFIFKSRKHKEHAVYHKQIVIIFDECHRSQFGDMHKAIVSYFRQYYMFGFTGTPIFSLNAGTSTQNPNYVTTEQTFGDQLHTYTIVDAINDKNVLPFRVDYIKTMVIDDDIDEE